MKWTLLVPGALLPASLAPEIAGAIGPVGLGRHLALARREDILAAGEGCSGAAHWAWLARRFGLPGEPPVTGPYAWGAPPDAADPQSWIAQCEPVHMAVGRDHMMLTDLGEPLSPDEAQELFDLAGEVLQAAGDAPHAAVLARIGFRFERRGTQWYLLATEAPQLQTRPLDSVLGRCVQERMPAGADARLWRVLSNEIQMLWHSSRVNNARESRDLRPANALWIHGGGHWQALPPSDVARLHVPGAGGDAAVLHGWQSAAQPGAPAAGGDTVSLDRGLFAAFAHQAWESWLARWDGLDARIEAEMDEARRAGAGEFELVLSGAHQARSWTVPLRRPWWRWPAGPGAARGRLQRGLAEPEARTKAAGAPR
jgi:hypothetical protein